MRVEVKSLTMHYLDAGRTVPVFNDLSFAIEDGSSVAIMGKSGVGKTTLLNIIAGLEHPVRGSVSINGTDITALPSSGAELPRFRGKNFGFIFQFHQLFPEFDAVENVAMPLLIQRVSRSEAFSRAKELLARVGLSDRLTHRPSQLSGGEQQRVAIARALSGQPGVILADEPTGNLDHQTGGEVAKLLTEVQREKKVTLIAVTHSAEFASLMDRIVELTPQGIVERNRSDLNVRR